MITGEGRLTEAPCGARGFFTDLDARGNGKREAVWGGGYTGLRWTIQFG